MGASIYPINPKTQKNHQSEFRSFVEETLKQWQVSGVAIAIVQNDQIILCEGFGLRNVEQNLPVTPETVSPLPLAPKPSPP
ncbi:serine hydrolase [Microcoleus sp. B4-C5]